MNSIEIVLWVQLGIFAAFYIIYISLMSFQAKKSNNVKMQKIFPTISLIIPTYNEETTIHKKLNNVKNLNYPKEKLEVILIDSGTKDKTIQIARNFQQNNPDLLLRLIVEEKRRGKASALNHAFSFSTGEIVVISDADSLIGEDSVTQIVSNFGDPLVGAVTGRQILLNAGQSVATNIERGYRDMYEVIRVGESQMDSTPIFHGELSAFRRNLIEDVAPESVADDTELAIRIRKKGYRAIYDPDAKFYEYAPPTLKARIKQKKRRGVGLIQQFLRFRHLMFNRAYGKYGLVILPSEFFMHIISPILLATLLVFFVLTLIINPFYLPFLALFLVIVLIAVSGLSIASKFASPNNKTPNPLAVMLAFLHSQMCLLLSIFSMLTKKENHQWEKIEDIRALWKP